MIRPFCVDFAFFESKKILMMKIARKCIQAACLLSFVSCGVSEIGDFAKDEGNGIWTGPPSGGSPATRSVTYVTAFDYPEDYNWRYNPEKGAVKCSLVVFANGKPTLKVPVGDAYCTSDDPDMHRVIDGHLFTDYATDDQTIIKKDGRPYISYDGRESVLAMIIQSDTLYTLGQRRNGRGFTFRKNGHVVLERSNGYPFAKMVSLDGDVRFAFVEQIDNAGGKLERYHCYMNGKVVQTALREDLKKAWDVEFHQGQVCILASLTGVSDPVVISDKGIYTLPLPYGTAIASGRIFSVGDILGAEIVLYTTSGLISALWLDNRLYRSFSSSQTLSSLWAGTEGLACVLNSRTDSGKGEIFRMGESYELPAGLSCQGTAAMDMTDGILTAGLSSVSGSRPVLWKDGEMEELDVNGYICTVSSALQSSQVRVLD